MRPGPGTVNDADQVFGEGCDVLRVLGDGLFELVGGELVGCGPVEVVGGLVVVDLGGAVSEGVVLPLETSVSAG